VWRSSACSCNAYMRSAAAAIAYGASRGTGPTAAPPVVMRMVPPASEHGGQHLPAPGLGAEALRGEILLGRRLVHLGNCHLAEPARPRSPLQNVDTAELLEDSAAPATLASTLVTSIVGVLTFIILSAHHQGPIAPDWGIGIALGVGGLVGGYLGALAQPHLPERIIRRILGLLVAAIGGRYAYAAVTRWRRRPRPNNGLKRYPSK
jgi:Sulfite exporter TauE/SafE